MEKKGIDSTFLHYGIKQNDMEIIEQVCIDCDVDSEWLKEKILKTYQEEKRTENLDEKKVSKIINKALKSL